MWLSHQGVFDIGGLSVKLFMKNAEPTGGGCPVLWEGKCSGNHGARGLTHREVGAEAPLTLQPVPCARLLRRAEHFPNTGRPVSACEGV